MRELAGAGTTFVEVPDVVESDDDVSDGFDLVEVLVAEDSLVVELGLDVVEEEHPAIAPIRTSAARTMRTWRLIPETIDASSRRR